MAAEHPANTARTAAGGFVELRDPAGKLLAKYDPARDLLEIGKRGEYILFDLSRYRQARDEDVDEGSKRIKG